MSCDSKAGLLKRVARRMGVSSAGSQSSYLAGNTSQLSFFSPQQATRKGKPKTSKSKAETKPKGMASKSDPGGQRTFFDNLDVARSPKEQPVQETNRKHGLPRQRQIRLTGHFSAEELQSMSVQLRLGAAAAARHITELKTGSSAGVDHSDPRPLDWARSDLQNSQFLATQLAAVRRGQPYLNTTALPDHDLVDLYDFTRFETERAMRNIDHLQSGWSHLKGPTAGYLTERHQVAARFYGYLAEQLEPLITPEMQDDYWRS